MNRIELDDDGVRCVFTDAKLFYQSIRDVGFFEMISRRDKFSDEERELIKSLYGSLDLTSGTIRVATARDFSENASILPDCENLAYVESEITEREPTEEELEPYEGSFMDGPETVNEFYLPPLECFEKPLECDDFALSINSGEQSVEELAEQLQCQVEHAKWLYVKTGFTGTKTNLPPNWNPESDSIESKKVKGLAKGRYFKAKEGWKDVFGLQYSAWFDARLNVLGRRERKLKSHEIVALELVDDSKDESFCQYCGKIDDENELFNVPDRMENEHRVCKRCAETYTEFTQDAIAKSMDKKAKETGGQRHLHSEFN